MQGIANNRYIIAKSYILWLAIKKIVWEALLYDLVFKWSGRQDSNLRPSAPKALNSSSAALGFQAITIFLLSSA